MKAGVFLGPGEVEVREWPEPVAGPGQVKVKIAYTGICGSDVESLHHRMGFQRVGLNFDGSGPARTEPVVEGHGDYRCTRPRPQRRLEGGPEARFEFSRCLWSVLLLPHETRAVLRARRVVDEFLCRVCRSSRRGSVRPT